MTNKEAIMCVGLMRTTAPACNEALSMAIKALERQEADRWIPFSKNYDEDYRAEILQSPLPDDGQEILVTDGKNVWLDTFITDGQECYLDSNSAMVDEVIAWRQKPIPEPYKE